MGDLGDHALPIGGDPGIRINHAGTMDWPAPDEWPELKFGRTHSSACLNRSGGCVAKSVRRILYGRAVFRSKLRWLRGYETTES